MNAANREAARVKGCSTRVDKDPAKIKANTKEMVTQALASDYSSQIGNANKGLGNMNVLRKAD